MTIPTYYYYTKKTNLKKVKSTYVAVATYVRFAPESSYQSSYSPIHRFIQCPYYSFKTTKRIANYKEDSMLKPITSKSEKRA